MHMWDLHIMMSKASCTLQGSKAAPPQTPRAMTPATNFIANVRGLWGGRRNCGRLERSLGGDATVRPLRLAR